MKISVSSNTDQGLESTVSGHFGRCPFFTFVEVNEKEIVNVEVISNPFFQGHKPFEVPNFLKQNGVDVILTQGMGGRAIGFFQENNITPVTGCSGTVKESVENFLAGNADVAAPCKESTEHHHD